MVAEYAAADPHFIALYESAKRRRALLRELAEKRQEIAALMSTSQSALARLETKAADARLSTIDRLADALGYRVEYRPVPRPALAVRGRFAVAGKPMPALHVVATRPDAFR
jgi:transcriptional regulator with XRE-family HTH domain